MYETYKTIWVSLLSENMLYSDNQFEGLCLGTSAEISVSGLNQSKAYFKLRKMHFRLLRSTISF